MSLAVSSERTHCSVGARRAQMEATVVPQEPPPKTTTFGSRIAAAMATSVLPSPNLYRLLMRSGPDAATIPPAAASPTLVIGVSLHLAGQRRLFIGTAEHHRLFDP